jgi:flagellar biosynthetic protein FlhB
MADDQDEGGKTEDPTQRKLDEARKKGQVPMSRELNHFMLILAAALVTLTIATPLMRSLGEHMMGYIANVHTIPASTPAEVGIALRQSLLDGLRFLFLPLLAFVVAGLAASLLQVGPMLAADQIMPKLERISIFKGISRLFSRRALMEFLKGVFKIGVVGAVVGWLLWPVLPTLDHTIYLPPQLLLAEVKALVLRLFLGALGVIIVITLADLLFQRLQFFKEMRMSRNELKEEYKQTEGDPQIRQRIRQIRMERARQRMMSEVPKADVVITNPDHYAIALQYQPEKNAAPMVLAMGMDLIAQKIKEVAKEHGIPLVENPPLARALYATAEIEREIPAEHYRAVAEIISYVYKLKNKSLPKSRK